MDFYNVKTIEQLTATLAHEVKNPVAMIKANIDYMQLNDSSGLYDKNYGVIKKELDKISCVVMDFIKLAKPSRESDKEIIFIYDVILEVVDEFSTPYGDKEVYFNVDCFYEDVKIYGIYSKICIVFFNIYKNAVEAIKEKGHIKTNIRKEKEFVVIEVCDDGEGINESIKDEVGTPFLTTKPSGSGLGIPICKSVLEEHGGSFEIKSNESGRGCCVIVKIPMMSEKD